MSTFIPSPAMVQVSTFLSVSATMRLHVHMFIFILLLNHRNTYLDLLVVFSSRETKSQVSFTDPISSVVVVRRRRRSSVC